VRLPYPCVHEARHRLSRQPPLSEEKWCEKSFLISICDNESLVGSGILVVVLHLIHPTIPVGWKHVITIDWHVLQPYLNSMYLYIYAGRSVIRASSIATLRRTPAKCSGHERFDSDAIMLLVSPSIQALSRTGLPPNRRPQPGR
jgi:hypothetical protein